MAMYMQTTFHVGLQYLTGLFYVVLKVGSRVPSKINTASKSVFLLDHSFTTL